MKITLQQEKYVFLRKPQIIPKRIYLNGIKTKFRLYDNAVWYQQNSFENCFIRKSSNTLALKAFKKALGII